MYKSLQLEARKVELRGEYIVAAHTFPHLRIIFILFQFHCSDGYFNRQARLALVALRMACCWTWPSLSLFIISSFTLPCFISYCLPTCLDKKLDHYFGINKVKVNPKKVRQNVRFEKITISKRVLLKVCFFKLGFFKMYFWPTKLQSETDSKYMYQRQM